jgi:hypothetical protein
VVALTTPSLLSPDEGRMIVPTRDGTGLIVVTARAGNAIFGCWAPVAPIQTPS